MLSHLCGFRIFAHFQSSMSNVIHILVSSAEEHNNDYNGLISAVRCGKLIFKVYT